MRRTNCSGSSGTPLPRHTMRLCLSDRPTDPRDYIVAVPSIDDHHDHTVKISLCLFLPFDFFQLDVVYVVFYSSQNGNSCSSRRITKTATTGLSSWTADRVSIDRRCTTTMRRRRRRSGGRGGGGGGGRRGGVREVDGGTDYSNKQTDTPTADCEVRLPLQVTITG